MTAGVWHTRLADEIRQAAEEGVVVDDVRDRTRALDAVDEAVYREWTRELHAAPRRADAPCEPNGWDLIVATLEEPPTRSPSAPDALFDALRAAWLGRAIGARLGAPVQGWNATRIRTTLEVDDAWPLRDYVDDGADARAFVPAIAFPVVGLGVAEAAAPAWAGDAPGWDAATLAAAWLARIPADASESAERAAIGSLRASFGPPESAMRYNPYREWAGAQRRADAWGYLTPGDPLAAARAAFEDASISHVKNGVYAALFFAAGVAAAFDASAPEDVIDAGLRTIPPDARLADAILETVRWAEEDDRWETTLHRIVARFGRYHWEHAIPNALVVLNALVHGRGSFRDTVSIAASSGFDTVGNGAIAGSIAGLLYGESAMPAALVEPLGGTVTVGAARERTCAIDALAERCMRVAAAINAGD